MTFYIRYYWEQTSEILKKRHTIKKKGNEEPDHKLLAILFKHHSVKLTRWYNTYNDFYDPCSGDVQPVGYSHKEWAKCAAFVVLIHHVGFAPRYKGNKTAAQNNNVS